MRTAITFSKNHDAHVEAGHFERPERLHAIHELLDNNDILGRLMQLDAAPATLEDILLVHARNYYDRLEAAVHAGGARLDPDTYATPHSLQVALEGVGGLLAITRAVLEQKTEIVDIENPNYHNRYKKGFKRKSKFL